ncbi:MAG: hypothetical protein ACP5HJ_03995 [Candidatus Micrarchaeia archaeon]
MEEEVKIKENNIRKNDERVELEIRESEKSIIKIEDRINRIEERIKSDEKRLDKIEERLNGIEKELREILSYVNSTKIAIYGLEALGGAFATVEGLIQFMHGNAIGGVALCFIGSMFLIPFVDEIKGLYKKRNEKSFKKKNLLSED